MRASRSDREGARRRLDSVRDPAQGELAQRHEIRRAEEALDRRGGFVCDVDLAGTQARQQIIGRQIDQLDVVGLIEDVVRQRLALAHAGDLRRRDRSGSPDAGR